MSVDPIEASLSELANNPTGTAEIGNTGVTGEVLPGTGNHIPAEMEPKHLEVFFES